MLLMMLYVYMVKKHKVVRVRLIHARFKLIVIDKGIT